MMPKGDIGTIVDIQAARFERRLPAAPERVWEHLTDCSLLEGWFGKDGQMEACEGGRVWFMGGHIRGIVTRCRQYAELAYTWNVFEDGSDISAYPESYLAFTLEAVGAETQLTLLHLPIPKKFQPQTCMGWHTFLDMLGDTIRTGSAKPREAYIPDNAALYGVDLGNLAR